MKVIDLLNKIANGEEVPKRIKINNVIYEYRGCMYCTEKANYQDIEDYLFGKWNFNVLNDEVEIIEEDKEIEELNISERRKRKDCYPLTVEIMAKINELIKEVNKINERR